MNSIKYGSPEFIALCQSLGYKYPRKKSMVIVFQGGSETDRSNAAKFLGLEARSKLLRIELTNIVSKYVEETEKNLNKLFEKAANLNAVLFFDEADALFENRSEKNSNEILFTLQKLQQKYPLVVILDFPVRLKIPVSLESVCDTLISFRSSK